jgi:uncharacterized protein (DUF1330 family)
MAKGYWIAAYRRSPDPAALAAYIPLAAEAIQAAGGRFLVRAGRQTVRDTGVDARTTLVEFDSYQQALDAYCSPAYQAALTALGPSIDRDARIVEGVS